MLAWLPALRAALAARRRRGGDRGHGAGRAEEPRLRGHRRGAAAERPVRGGRRGDHLRALLHVPAHLDGAELVAGGRRGRRGGRDRPRRTSRRRSWSRRSRWRPGCCSCCSRCCGWDGSRSFLSKAVVTGFLAGAAIDVVIGELPKLTGTSAEGDNAWRELGVVGAARSATCTGRPCSSASSALAVILGLRFAGARGSRRARARGRRPARLVAVRPRRARRGAGRRRAARAARPGAARPRRWSGTTTRRSRIAARRAAADRVLPDRRRRPGVRRAAPLPDRRRTRSRWPRGWRTSAPACSRGCRCRPASRPAR